MHYLQLLTLLMMVIKHWLMHYFVSSQLHASTCITCCHSLFQQSLFLDAHIPALTETHLHHQQTMDTSVISMTLLLHIATCLACNLLIY